MSKNDESGAVSSNDGWISKINSTVKLIGWAITTVIAAAGLWLSIATYLHEDTSAIPSVSVTPGSLITKSASDHGSWSITVTGSGFNGDTKVYVHYPTVADVNQPLPSGVDKNTPFLCPSAATPTEVSSGGFALSGVQISKDLPDGTYRIYAIGVNSGAEAYFTIQIGPAPQQSPLPAPTSGNTPAGLQNIPTGPRC